jgi:hypothetical protein
MSEQKELENPEQDLENLEDVRERSVFDLFAEETEKEILRKNPFSTYRLPPLLEQFKLLETHNDPRVYSWWRACERNWNAFVKEHMAYLISHKSNIVICNHGLQGLGKSMMAFKEALLYCELYKQIKGISPSIHFAFSQDHLVKIFTTMVEGDIVILDERPRMQGEGRDSLRQCLQNLLDQVRGLYKSVIFNSPFAEWVSGVSLVVETFGKKDKYDATLDPADMMTRGLVQEFVTTDKTRSGGFVEFWVGDPKTQALYNAYVKFKFQNIANLEKNAGAVSVKIDQDEIKAKAIELLKIALKNDWNEKAKTPLREIYWNELDYAGPKSKKIKIVEMAWLLKQKKDNGKFSFETWSEIIKPTESMSPITPLDSESLEPLECEESAEVESQGPPAFSIPEFSDFIFNESDYSEQIYERMEAKLKKDAFSQHPDRDLAIIKKKILEDTTHHDLAAEFGLSQAAIKDILKKGRAAYSGALSYIKGLMCERFMVAKVLLKYPTAEYIAGASNPDIVIRLGAHQEHVVVLSVKFNSDSRQKSTYYKHELVGEWKFAEKEHKKKTNKSVRVFGLVYALPENHSYLTQLEFPSGNPKLKFR